METLRRMILYKRKSSPEQNLKVRLRNEPYLIINIFFAGVILLIIAYFGFFSPEKDNYPVICLHEKLTGEQCFSCGLSHSFSLIVRGRIDEAYRWNLYGMRVFLFFASQLILRVVFSIFYLWYPDTRKQLIIIDCIGSGLIFLISFWPFIARIISDIL
ncbi:MAG: DUF2752 domain-containing protein [Bacteroidales bacterium]|nr:DUF2752 domain-containing protein [Bacteroidales bacterium]MDP3001734.1 DUF2752 domain-containing protein [Bacteroidales bacterium]